MGARFDVALHELKKGNFRPASGLNTEELIRKYDHGEL